MANEGKGRLISKDAATIVATVHLNAYLSVCYFKLNDFQKSYEHYLKAKSILKNDLKLIELDQFFLKNKGFK